MSYSGRLSKMILLYTVVILNALVGPLVAAEIVVTSPKDDCIVHSRQVTISGSLELPTEDGPVQVRSWSAGAGVGNPSPCAIQQGNWKLTDLALEPGLNVLRVSCGAKVTFLRINVVVPQPVPAAHPLRVFLRWPEETQDDSIRQLLRAIPFRDMNTTDLSAWPAAVKRRTRILVEDVYMAAQVPLTIVDQPGAGVQTIQINGMDIRGNTYGSTSRPDFGNTNPNNACNIYLQLMSSRMSSERVTFHPMNGNDYIVERAENISHFIAYSTAHELGHCLGLVGCDCFDDPQGAWMMGLKGGHNHGFLRDFLRENAFPDYEEQETRGGNGFELMDDGEGQLPRIYTAHPDGPGITARWIHINSINRAYLKMLYPSDQ